MNRLFFISLAFTSILVAEEGLTKVRFSGPEQTPSPAVIAVAPTGEVFVGVDKQGSLGKKIDHGEVVRLVDTNDDGKADKVTTFAKISPIAERFCMILSV